MRFSFFLIFFLFSGFVFAQNSAADSLFTLAQKAYQAGQMKEALAKAKMLMKEDGSMKNYDHATLASRIFLANGFYEKADSLVVPFWKADAPNVEILELKWRIQASKNDWTAARKWAEMGLQSFPVDSDTWNWRKTISSFELKKVDEGLEDWKLLSDSLQKSDAGQSLKTDLLRQLPRTVGIHWWNAQINQPQPLPWNLFQVEYGDRSAKLPWNVRGSYGAFFGLQSVQLEGECYPKLGKNAYGYLHLGLSPSGDLFPFARLSAEYFKAFSKGEWSAGMKHLRYSSLQVTLATAHAELDFGKGFNVGARSYLGLAQNKVFPAQAVWLRKNWPQREQWVQADFQVGQIPYAWIFIPGLEPVSSVRTGFQAQLRVKDYFFVRPLLAFEREEYYPARFRNRINSQITLQYRF